MMKDRNQIAYELAFGKANDNNTDQHLIQSELLQGFREFADHPAGGDPRAIGAPHDHQRKAENAKYTEIAFAALTAILAVIFSFLSYYIPLPPVFALLILIVLCGVIAAVITIAVRRALIWIFQVDGKNEKAVRRLWFLFSVSFTVFLVALIACLLARYAAIGPVDMVGIEQMMVEVSGLLCAGAAGASRHHYEDILNLVAKIQGYLRQLGRIETAQQSLHIDTTQLKVILPSSNGSSLSAKASTTGEGANIVSANK